jgi:hypothetical protein
MSADIGSKGSLLTEIVAGRELPEGCDEWAYRTVAPDFRSRGGYRYPFPGGWAEAPGPVLDHAAACPEAVGDGICAATSWAGMASAGRPATTVLLVAYSTTDLLGGDAADGKVRLRRMLVVDVIDGAALVRGHGRSANLRRANLRWTDLSSADLRWADLSSADLSSANLRSADLRWADLRSADLRWADLSSAEVRSADLRSADLRWADLRRADLRWADLSSADLSSANLRSARADKWTTWPEGFDHIAAGVVSA